MTPAALSAFLERHGIPHAVIGAVALAVHGVPRASADVDVLVTDRRCLEDSTWAEIVADGHAVDVRRGDADDPLAGVVRVMPTDGMPIDVVVGRARWQDEAIGRAQRTDAFGARLPVVTAVDLVLLKLYAGGPQDAWDVEQLLDVEPSLATAVAAAVGVLPPPALRLWERVRDGRRGR